MEKVVRNVSDLAAMFHDQETVKSILSLGDKVVYVIRYYPFITSKSDMALGTTVILSGKVGDEYHMTKGHFHARDDQPEIYYCVQGEGFLQMESRDGDYHAVPWKAGTITHIPPQYAHRVINTGRVPLVFVASFHVSAGHEYDLIEARGFRNIFIERDGKVAEVPNPRRTG
ncbi:MAG: glucose-6-phosphate isomerase family protein [Anaerolineales bacterium]